MIQWWSENNASNVVVESLIIYCGLGRSYIAKLIEFHFDSAD